MKRYIYIIFLLLLFKTNSSAQTEAVWFPANLNIHPFTAHFLEPRNGIHYLSDLKKVRIDIGTSKDIIQWNSQDENFSIGADFFTYSRARLMNNSRFPVEAIDYLGGLNAGYKHKKNITEWGSRLRFSHISAHLVDGAFNQWINEWRYAWYPFVYSKEFFELITYYKINNFRTYAGLTYNIHILPEEIGKEIFQAGFDYYITPLKTSSFIPFVAYDFKTDGIKRHTGNNIISTGIKFGEPESKGLRVIASYFSGKSVHGELYFMTENYASIGISLDI